jgi:hypothetical protein
MELRHFRYFAAVVPGCWCCFFRTVPAYGASHRVLSDMKLGSLILAWVLTRWPRARSCLTLTVALAQALLATPCAALGGSTSSAPVAAQPSHGDDALEHPAMLEAQTETPQNWVRRFWGCLTVSVSADMRPEEAGPSTSPLHREGAEKASYQPD